MPNEVPMKLSCPVLNCPNQTRSINWTHGNCGGSETIDSKAMIKCTKCKKTWSLAS